MVRKHLYENPVPVEELVPEHPSSLVIRLPQPPNGDAEDLAFLYRIKGKTVGFFNRCGHVRLPMDLDDGKFFDLEGMIICRVHGARFDEEHGNCLMGPAYTGLYRLILRSDDVSSTSPSVKGSSVSANISQAESEVLDESTSASPAAKFGNPVTEPAHKLSTRLESKENLEPSSAVSEQARQTAQEDRPGNLTSNRGDNSETASVWVLGWEGPVSN
ncbi:MAG: hypothetical protein CMF59_10940 [Leptospiraceae bacterium]|nr:hypothetical protein [Leptospiraceae bacterium]